jgi:hypothetical protein
VIQSPNVAPEGECNSGHSLEDDVEWPCDLELNGVSGDVFNNPTPEALAALTSQSINDFVPVLYNGDAECNKTVAKSYYDIFINFGLGRLITRTWNVIHWPTGETFIYVQKISLNTPEIDNCKICDTLAWNTPVTDCTGGHSNTDAVEWPADVYLNEKRFSPTDLSHNPEINPKDVMPALSEACKTIFQVSFSDIIFNSIPDSLIVERTWTLFNTVTQEVHSYIQRLYVVNPLSFGSSMVCVRQLNGNPLNDVTLYSGNSIENGPCKEFIIDPAHTLVKPIKESTDYFSGVDLADLIMLYEYILGIRTLGPSQLLAGDFNGTSGVTTLDVVLLTKMINGEQVDLSNWPSPWKFMYEELQPNLFNVRDYVILNQNSAPHSGHHFIGYKLGDINDSYLENNLQTIPVDVFDEIITAGETYTVPFYSNHFINANGIQFKVHKNGKTKILDVRSNFFEKFEITEFSTYYSVIGYNENFISKNILVDDLFLNITFSALKNSILSEALVLLDGDHHKFIIADTYAALPFKITFEDIISSSRNINRNPAISIYPNPVFDKLFINGLPEGNEVEILDIHGNQVNNSHTLTEGMINVDQLIPGIYILNTKSKEGQYIVKRFVKI